MTRAYLRGRSWQSIAYPGQPYYIARIHTRRHQHHCEVPWSHFGRRCCNDEGDHGKVHRPGDVKIALARPIGMPRIQKCGQDCKNIRRHGQEKRIDIAVAKGLDDGGEKIRYSARSHEAEDDDHLAGTESVSKTHEIG